MKDDSRACPECGEPMKNIDYDENDNRIRTADLCATHGEYWGCLAKRLDDNGKNAWGPPGVQHLSKAVRSQQ